MTDTITAEQEAIDIEEESDIWNNRTRILIFNDETGTEVSRCTIRRLGIVKQKELDLAEKADDEKAMCLLYIDHLENFDVDKNDPGRWMSRNNHEMLENWFDGLSPEHQELLLEKGGEINLPLLDKYRARKKIREERLAKAGGFDQEKFIKNFIAELRKEDGSSEALDLAESSISSSAADTESETS